MFVLCGMPVLIGEALSTSILLATIIFSGDTMIFLTGGTGFLGRHLVPALCRSGLPVRVLTRNPAANQWLHHYKNVEVVAGDLLDERVIEKAIEGCDYVIHAAVFSGFGGMRRHLRPPMPRYAKCAACRIRCGCSAIYPYFDSSSGGTA